MFADLLEPFGFGGVEMRSVYLTDSWQHSGRMAVPPSVCVRMDTKLQHLGLVKQSGALGEGASEVTLGLTLVLSILKLVYFLSR